MRMRNLDLGLLILRAGVGLLFFLGHGLSKLLNFSALSTSFPDPIGLGPTISLILAILAEVVCALALVIGLKTRWVAIPPLITMLVAGLIFHSVDPWSKKELAFLYALVFLTLIFTGGGLYSLDRKMGPRR